MFDNMFVFHASVFAAREPSESDMTSDDKAPRCLRIAPKICKYSPRIALIFPNMPKDSTIMVQHNSKFDQSNPQILARALQDCPNIAQDYL